MPVQVSEKCCCQSWCQSVDTSPGVRELVRSVDANPSVREVLMPVLVSEKCGCQYKCQQSVAVTLGVKLMPVLVSVC